MARVLATDVHVYDKDGNPVVLERGSEVPKKYADQVTNPAAYIEADAEEEQSDDESDGSKGYADQTIDELKAELKKRELPVSGKHDELVARLIEADAEEEQSDDESDGDENQE